VENCKWNKPNQLCVYEPPVEGCDGLGKNACKAKEGCEYKNKQCVEFEPVDPSDLCPTLAKGACKKEALCVFANGKCCPAETGCVEYTPCPEDHKYAYTWLETADSCCAEEPTDETCLSSNIDCPKTPCIDYQGCGGYDGKKTCRADAKCQWIAAEKICNEKIVIEGCEGLKKNPCKDDVNCVWDNSRKLCSEGVAGCAGLQKKFCLADETCSWDNPKKTCSDAGAAEPEEPESCADKGKKACLADKANCVWTNKIKLCADAEPAEPPSEEELGCDTFAKAACQAQEAENVCWWDNKDLACRDGRKPCSANTKNPCRESERCVWDNRAKVCSEPADEDQ